MSIFLDTQVGLLPVTRAGILPDKQARISSRNSGSLLAGIHLNDCIIRILPIGILFLNQMHFPLLFPVFQLFFFADGGSFRLFIFRLKDCRNDEWRGRGLCPPVSGGYKTRTQQSRNVCKVLKKIKSYGYHFPLPRILLVITSATRAFSYESSICKA